MVRLRTKGQEVCFNVVAFRSFARQRPRSKQPKSRRMVSSGMLRRVALVRTDVSEEFSASFIRVTRIGELGTTLAVTSNRRTLRRYDGGATFFRKAVLTRATRRNISEDCILDSSASRQGPLDEILHVYIYLVTFSYYMTFPSFLHNLINLKVISEYYN
jgi:hypothetical protein